LRRAGSRLWLPALAAAEAVLVAVVATRLEAGRKDHLSGMLFVASVSLGLVLAGEAVLRTARVGGSARQNARLALASTALALLPAEALLRFGLRRYATYLEKNNQAYASPFEHDRTSWFHVYPAHWEVVYPRPEFRHVRQTNALGLCDGEVGAKAPGEFRIIALGDSYTEGIGAPFEETWVKVAGRRLAASAPGRPVTTLNAGVSGSDVHFEAVLLREKLLALEPDLVIVATNSSDEDDVVVRGGRARFNGDGSLAPSPLEPSWEWVYGLSFIARHVVHDVLRYNWLLVPQRRYDGLRREAAEDVAAVLQEVAELGRRRGFALLVVFHPIQGEAVRQEWLPGMDRLQERLSAMPGVATLDLLGALRVSPEDSAQLFWPLDGHYTPRGYAIMGEAVARTVLEKRLLPPSPPR
jgi:lysophospholipase L1-like esterase